MKYIYFKDVFLIFTFARVHIAYHGAARHAGIHLWRLFRCTLLHKHMCKSLPDERVCRRKFSFRSIQIFLSVLNSRYQVEMKTYIVESMISCCSTGRWYSIMHAVSGGPNIFVWGVWSLIDSLVLEAKLGFSYGFWGWIHDFYWKFWNTPWFKGCDRTYVLVPRSIPSIAGLRVTVGMAMYRVIIGDSCRPALVRGGFHGGLQWFELWNEDGFGFHGGFQGFELWNEDGFVDVELGGVWGRFGFWF